MIVRDILPKDDGFYGLTKPKASEWWYFEALFENNYSIVFSFAISLKNLIAFPSIEIYKNGKLEKRLIKRYLTRDFEASKNFPFVRLLDKKIIKFNQNRFNATGEWVYNISVKIDDYEIDLTFNRITQGWQINNEFESWIVSLPKAIVTGEITIEGKKMKVKGIGYHDHNWINNLSTAFDVWGWFWGKLASRTLNVAWANIVRNSSKNELIAVVNQDNEGYYQINQKNIFFKENNYIQSYGRKMPTMYSIKINDVVNKKPILVDVNMIVKEIHRRFKRLIFAPYWRYHIEANGFISLGSHKEQVNKNQIMEFFRLI